MHDLTLPRLWFKTTPSACGSKWLPAPRIPSKFGETSKIKTRSIPHVTLKGGAGEYAQVHICRKILQFRYLHEPLSMISTIRMKGDPNSANANTSVAVTRIKFRVICVIRTPILASCKIPALPFTLARLRGSKWPQAQQMPSKLRKTKTT